MAAFPGKPEQMGTPVRGLVVFLSLVIALFLNLLPFQGLVLALRPDFVALVMLYWCINQPRKVGIGSAWFLGLLMDVADATVFGQHALVYTLMSFLSIALHRRVQRFSLWQQALHVLVLLLTGQLLMVGIRFATGATFIGGAYFVGSVLGALLWTPLSIALQIAQRKKIDQNSYEARRT